jgi:hypothetical protein
MDGTRLDRRVAAAGGQSSGVHPFRFPVEQRLHLAALLIVFAALPLCAQDVKFDPNLVTQANFSQFSRIVGQAIFATPVQPARASGFFGFDVGVAATVVPVDEKSAYWRAAVPAGSNFTTNGYVGVPRLVASKGFGFGTLSGTYAKISNSGIATWGGAFDMPLVRGGVVKPELALRVSYSTLTGVDVFREKTYGGEVFLSKGFGPVMPYAAVGRMRINAQGDVPASLHSAAFTLTDRSNVNRYTVGVRLSLLVPKLVLEATQAEVRSYAAKVSFGF